MKAYTASLLLLLSTLALPVFANDPPVTDCQKTITWQNRGEMFVEGGFHVKDTNGNVKGTFLVNYLPGTANIAHDAKEHLKSAVETLKPFLEGERFWKNNIWKSVTDGFKWGWDANKECGMGAIPRDFKHLWADFKSVKVGEFGAIGHKVLDVAGFGASVVCRPIIGAGALVGGAAAGIVVPPLKVAGRMCWALGEATVCGLGYPMVKFLWNGIGWAATAVYTHVPPEQNSLMLTWVPAKSNAESCPLPKDEL